ncbi:MAG: MFS transporter [Xanthobacteraceae bacterium]
MSTALPSRTAADGHSAISAAALMATYMQAVNISLPNAALPHIQGTLSMANDEVGWVFSSYIAASAVAMSMTHWLAGRYGRKAIYQFSAAVFALALIIDTRATTPVQFVLARIVQGAASGPLALLSLAILLDVLSPARHARISLAWTLCFLLGISSGPSIGGWLSEYHGWRSIFYFSLPMTGFIFLAMALLLREKKAERNPPFDFFGLATFSLGMIGLQMLLDRGRAPGMVRLSGNLGRGGRLGTGVLSLHRARPDDEGAFSPDGAVQGPQSRALDGHVLRPRLRPAADPGFDLADAGGIAQLSGRYHRLHDPPARHDARGDGGADELGSGTNRLPAVHARRNGAGGLCQLAPCLATPPRWIGGRWSRPVCSRVPVSAC